MRFSAAAHPSLRKRIFGRNFVRHDRAGHLWPAWPSKAKDCHSRSSPANMPQAVTRKKGTAQNTAHLLTGGNRITQKVRSVQVCLGPSISKEMEFFAKRTLHQARATEYTKDCHWDNLRCLRGV